MKIRFRRKIGKFGGSYRITIPKEIVEALSLRVGDSLTISLTDEGMIEMVKE